MNSTATATTMTSKGQVTLPKELRDRLGLQQGDVIEFIEENGKIIMRRAQSKTNPFLQWALFEGERPTENARQNAVDWQRDLRGWDDKDRELLG